jgi:hypothetical protein
MRAGKFFKRNGELVNATPDFLFVHGGEPQLQSFPPHSTAKTLVGLRPSFSAQVRFGEPGAPVLFLFRSARDSTVWRRGNSI